MYKHLDSLGYVIFSWVVLNLGILPGSKMMVGDDVNRFDNKSVMNEIYEGIAPGVSNGKEHEQLVEVSGRETQK